MVEVRFSQAQLDLFRELDQLDRPLPDFVKIYNLLVYSLLLA